MSEGRCGEKLFALWSAHMRHGDFEAAWQISDRILKAPPSDYLPRHLRPVWRGSPLAGKRVLIRCYRGLGDTVQFIRYAAQVKEIASEVFVSTQDELAPLLRTMPAIDRVVELDHDSGCSSWDVDLEVTELPYIFRTTLNSIPADVPYFFVEPESIQSNGRLAVGIVWAAGDWDPRRSIPTALLGPLAKIPAVRLFSFQRGPHSGGGPELPMIGLDWCDIVHEAGLLLAMDLLVSVDTMPAHLAGALGVPVWLLMHSDPDWRWMEERDDSPWYPSMRVFRQRRPGDWTEVLERVAGELRRVSGKYRE